MQCFFRCLLRNHFLPDLSRFFVQVKSIYKHRKKTKIVSYIKLRVKFFSANPLIWVLCIATAKFLWHFFLWRQRYHFIPDLSMKCPSKSWKCVVKHDISYNDEMLVCSNDNHNLSRTKVKSKIQNFEFFFQFFCFVFVCLGKNWENPCGSSRWGLRVCTHSALTRNPHQGGTA